MGSSGDEIAICWEVSNSYAKIKNGFLLSCFSFFSALTLKQVLKSSYTYRDQLFYLLTDQIKKLEDDRNSLQSAKAGLQDECKTLSQKVDILNELYQQEEMALHR